MVSNERAGANIEQQEDTKIHWKKNPTNTNNGLVIILQFRRLARGK